MAKRARTPTQDRRSEQLSSVALDLFARHGYFGVSIKQIARKAHVNPALIYYYYQDKADLFRAAIVHAVSSAHEHYLRLLSKYEDPRGRIHAWLESNVVVAQRIRSLVKIMLDYSGSTLRNPGIDRAISEFYALERRILVENIRRGISEKVFRATDPDRLAALIAVHLDGVMVAASIRAPFDLNGAIDDLKELLTHYIGSRGYRQSKARGLGRPPVSRAQLSQRSL